jgi:1L-myo-inositol 1-phosphate cytidylyltransferase
MKCLIVAAGQGARLREKGELKPLIPIKGVPLIECVISRARDAGVDQFFVVSGYRGAELRNALDRFAAREAVSITHILNTQWDRANGVSVLSAKAAIDGEFLLTMCDHLVDPEILRCLIAAPTEADTVTLAVDFNLDRPLNDPEDVTRVKCANGRIAHIGKVIRDYNAFDTGVFRCSGAMFAALEAAQAEGDDSISGAINMLARWGQARIFDIGDRIWIDVDDPAAFRKAEALLDEGRL